MTSKTILFCALSLLVGCNFGKPQRVSSSQDSQPAYYYSEDPWTGPGWYEGEYYANEKDFRRHYGTGGNGGGRGAMENRAGRGGRGSNWTR